ncbi:MAG: CHAT domain-containing protein [Gammaproteobacteria bacterium]|nr:CHAT domain-containing protein [Gammaproteobacteria bacterium]
MPTARDGGMPEVVALPPDGTVRRVTLGGEGGRWRLPLQAQEAATLEIEQLEGAVEVTLERPGAAAQRLRTEAGRQGRVRATLIGAAEGALYLQLLPRRRAATVAMRLGPGRAATAQDLQRSAAFGRYVEAEALRREHYRETVVSSRTPAIDATTRAAYVAAIEGYESADDGCGLRIAAIGAARMEVSAGEYARARVLVDRALGARCADDAAERAQALKTRGMAAAYQGDLAASAAAAEQALALYRETGDRLYEGVVLGNLSSVYAELGESLRALEAARGALEAAIATSDAQGIVYSRKTIGAIELARGRFAAALTAYRETLEALRTTPYPMIEGETWNDLGLLHHRMGEYAEAERAWERAQQVWTRMRYRFGSVDTLLSQSEARLERGRRELAESGFRRARALAQADGLKSPEARALLGLGSTRLAAGDWPAARARLRESLALAESIGDRDAQAAALQGLGDLEFAQGSPTGARQHYEQSLVLLRAAADLDGEALALVRLARAQGAQGDLAGALARLEAAHGIIETQRGQIAEPRLRMRFYATARESQDLEVELLMAREAREPGRGHAAAALAAAERARARALLDSLSERTIEVRRDVEPALLQAEREAAESLRSAALRLARLPAGAEPAQRAATRREVDAASTALDAARGRIRAANPRHAGLLQPRALGLEEIQRELLDDGMGVLAYWLGEHGGVAWLTTRDGLRTQPLPPRAQAEREVERFVAGLRETPAGTPADAAALAAAEAAALGATNRAAVQLGRMLLGELLRGQRLHLLAVVADGALQRLPFGLLVDPASARPVHAAHELVYLPSFATLRGLREAAPQLGREPRVAVLADPLVSRAARNAGGAARSRALDDDFDLRNLAPLPQSRTEALRIARLLPAERRWVALADDASREAVLQADWSRWSIAHFAAHALVDLQRPELSGIVLSLYDRDGRPRDGFLRLNDIYELRMPVALVVLSACDSALGRNYGSEGAFSLARAFFYAGAPRVVASLWPVDDRATARFMESFYDALLRRGLTPAAALRDAQHALAREPRWRAPRYWAGFVLQGDWR